jgi:hypothetical protein
LIDPPSDSLWVEQQDGQKLCDLREDTGAHIDMCRRISAREAVSKFNEAKSLPTRKLAVPHSQEELIQLAAVL